MDLAQAMALTVAELDQADHDYVRDELGEMAATEALAASMARPPPSTRRLPCCMGKRSTKRVLEYARLAMGFANVRAGTRVLKLTV